MAVAITEREALKLKVIDLVAALRPRVLLEKIDGRTIKLPKGTVTLADERAAPVRPIEIGLFATGS